MESDYTRLQRQRMSNDDFEPLTIIGRGAFGEVHGNGVGPLACMCAWSLRMESACIGFAWPQK